MGDPNFTVVADPWTVEEVVSEVDVQAIEVG
jgi:hypothetical protein